MSDGKTIKLTGADYIVTVDPERRVIRDGAIVVKDGVIDAVGTAAELESVAADETIDASGKLITPGFINTHEHLYGHIMRGMNSDVIDVTYIKNACAVRDLMTDDEETLTSLATITEFLKYGTTTFVNPGDSTRIHAVMKAYEQSGCRAVVGMNQTDTANSLGAPVSADATEALAKLRDTQERYDGACDGRITGWVMLSYGTEMVSEKLVVGAKALADELGTGMTYHQSPRQEQVRSTLEKHGMRPIEYLDKIGAIGPNVLLGHAIHLDDNEVEIIARTDTKLGMSPITSLRLGFGTTKHGKLPELVDAGACIGLGTDTTDFGIADLLKSAQLAATIYKDARMDTKVVPGEKALEMITIDGARAAGLEDQVGSLEVGKKADLVLFDLSRPEWQPLLNPVHALIYHADGRSVDTVMVDGRVLIDGGKPTFIDDVELGERLEDGARGLLERTGIKVEPRWPTVE